MVLFRWRAQLFSLYWKYAPVIFLRNAKAFVHSNLHKQSFIKVILKKKKKALLYLCISNIILCTALDYHGCWLR